METKLHWKKELLKNTYEIYSGDALAGWLKENIWSQSSEGELNGEKFVFKVQGFFRQKTLVIDTLNNKLVGEISYNNWMTNATIKIMDKIFIWKYNNWLNTRWTIYGTDGILIQYKGSSSKGSIESSTKEDLLILTGLYVTNYYWQITVAVLIAVLVSIWITLIN